MWFFMISCYVCTGLSLILLLLNGLQGYVPFSILNANHAAIAILTIIVYLFTETLIIFFFVGIGVSIKEYVQANKLSAQYHQRSLAIKRKVYPPLLFNMLLVMILFISGGAAHTGAMPIWLHGLLFYVSVIHFLYTIRIQHRSFKESTALVLEMSGIKQD